MIAVGEFLPRVVRAVRAVAPGAPLDMLEADIASAAAQFLLETKLITRDTTLHLQECVNEYALEPCVDGMVPAELASVHVNGRSVRVRGGANYPDAQCHPDRGVALDYEQLVLVFDGTICDGDVAKVRVVMKTTGQPCDPVPDMLFTNHEHHEAIANGAIARALTDLGPKAAVLHERKFQMAVSRAVARRIAGYGGGPGFVFGAGFIAR